ncbi:MAG: ATP-binding protein [bacterium]|nr:ATP-binding protein [bacterium]
MATIATQSLSQLVKVHKNIGESVNFRKAFFDVDGEERSGSNFYPMAPQAEALRAVAESALSGGSILLAGNAGTGKSSLLHMFADLLTIPYPGEDFSALIGRVSDVSIVRSLTALRTEGRRWLVVAPEFGDKDDFDSALQRALSGALFSQGSEEFVPSGSSLIDDFSQTSDFLHNKGEFDGIVVVCDSVDDLIDHLLKEPDSFISGQVQKFTKFCASSRFPVLFSAASDQDMSQFTVAEEEILVKFFQKIQPVTILGRIGEWEELVGKHVLEHPEGEVWKEVTEYKDFRAVAESLSHSGLYQGSSDRWLTEIVMQGGYPMHPSALFALPRMVSCLTLHIKNAFNFFNDSSPGGFTYFLRNFAVVQPNGRLHLYTADSLYTYFEKVIQNDPANKDYVDALQKAVSSAGDIPQARRILRMVLVFQMVGSDRLRTKADDLIWALHLGERETRIARHSLDLLVQRKSLIYVEATGEYLLPVQREKVSLDDALNRMRSRVRVQLDVRGELQSALPRKRYMAEGFNARYNTDRSVFAKTFVYSDMKDPVLFMDEANKLGSHVRPYRGDIMVALTIPEQESELTALRADLEAGKFNSDRLIVGIPKEASNFSKEILEVHALERLRVLEPPFSDPSTAENKQIVKMLEASSAAMKASLAKLFDYKNFVFYYNGKLDSDMDEEAFKRYIDEKITVLVGKPTVMTEPSLGFVRDPGHARRQRQVAINYLLSCTDDIAVRADFGAPGRILKKSLAEAGIIKAVEEKSQWTHYELAEKWPEDGFAAGVSFLRSQIIAGAGGEKMTPAVQAVMPLLEAPYSFTPSAAEMMIAVLAWKWNRSLQFCKNWQRAQAEGRNELLETVPITAESIFELVGNPDNWAIKYIDATEDQKKYLSGFDRFCTEDGHEDSLWIRASHGILSAYSRLPQAAKVPGASGDALADSLCEALEEAKSLKKDNELRDFAEKTLPKVLGMPDVFSWSAYSNEMISSLHLAFDKLERVVSSRRERLERGLAKVFQPEGEELSWNEAGARWLSTQKREELAPWKDEAQALDESCGSGNLEDLLEGLGFEPFDKWDCDHDDEIIERFRAMREDTEWAVYSSAYSAETAEQALLSLSEPVLSQFDFDSDYLEGMFAEELETVSWPRFAREAAEKDDEEEEGAEPKAETPAKEEAPAKEESPADIIALLSSRQQEKEISLDFLFDNSVCLPRPKTVEPRRGAQSAFWQLSAQLRQRENDVREAQERAEAEAAAAEAEAAAAAEAAFPPPPEMSFEEESLVPDDIAEMVEEQPAPVQEEAPASTSRVELDESLLEWL